MVGGPVLMAIGLCYLGIIAAIPFVAGVLGFSRWPAYITTGILTLVFICLGIGSAAEELKYQGVYWFAISRILMTVLFAAELLLAFSLSHWVGARIRSGFIFVTKRLKLRTYM